MPFIEPADMDTAEPLPGWKGRFWRPGSMSFSHDFSHYDVEAGCSIHEHHHANEEVWMVVAGLFEVTVGDETQTAGPGAVAVVPPDVRHSVRVLEGGSAIVANHPVRTDLR